MSRRSSRRSSRHGGKSRAGSSSPPPLPTSSPPPLLGSSPGTQIAEDEKISILDPRRFTPTLHASLVSEILTLRREIESKNQFIGELEGNLANTKSNKDELVDKLARSEKERRSLKRQFQQLEHGTLSALEELAKDRDEAKENGADLKLKLEAADKRIRGQEEDAERLQSQLENDRNTWDAEKIGLERRVHVTETRLKTVLEGLAAEQEAAQFQANIAHGDEDDNTKDSGLGEDASDTASVRSMHMNGSPFKRHSRTMSRNSQRSLKGFRISTASFMGVDGQKLNGISLADELQLDEEDEDYMDIGDDDEDYPEHELRARRVLESRLSHHHDEKAKRLLGLISRSSTPALYEYESASPERRGRLGGRNLESRFSMAPIPKVQYVDTGVQFSPPPSPVLAAQSVTGDFFDTTSLEIGTQTYEDEIVAIAAPPLMVDGTSQTAYIPEPVMVSSGQQTAPEPEQRVPVMISTSAQTIDSPLSPHKRQRYLLRRHRSKQSTHCALLEAFPRWQVTTIKSLRLMARKPSQWQS